MGADIIIASTAAVKFRCSTSSAPSLRLAQVSGQPKMSGPDNSRNYHDFVSKCCIAMREIAESVSQNPQYDVAGDIASRLARNKEILSAAREKYVPPSGRAKKGIPRKRTIPDIQQVSSTHWEADENGGSRPNKVTKTAEGQSAPNAMDAVESKTPGSSTADPEASAKKRKNGTMTKTKTAEQTPESYYVGNAKRFLESYTFTRVILDEYSFKDHEVETFVDRAIASSKWLLSGTPPLTKLSLVCRTASMLSVHIARIEPALPSHLHEITEGPSAADMSASEAYRALRQLKTTTFAHERHQQGLNFVELFAKRNPAMLGDGFKLVQKVFFISRDTPVIAHYIRLQQCLYAARWDVQGLSHDGNELLKAVTELEKSDETDNSRRARSKSWIQDNSTDGRLDAAVQALLMHATLPSNDFHATPTFDTPGMTICDSLERLCNDAELSYRRLCSTLKSQFDRLGWLVAQFSKMEIKASQNDDEESNDQGGPDDNEEDTGNEIESGGGQAAESAENELLEHTGEEAMEAEEQEGPSPAALTAIKKANSKDARDRKFRQASQYLDWLVDDVVHQKEKSIGGREILSILGAAILDGWEHDPLIENGDRLARGFRKRRTNVPGTSYLVDWYQDIAQRLSDMSDEELKLVYMDCADLLGYLRIENFDGMGIDERRAAATSIICAAQTRRREQFVDDDVEQRSGLAEGPAELQTYRMMARKIGLKCLSSDTLETLRDRYNQHRRGRCSDKFWEFALGLTFRFPIKGITHHLRGTDVEEGLEDLTWTSQSVTAGAYEKIPEAFHRYRFLLTVLSLAREVLDGRLCDGCGKTGVPSNQIRLTVGCSHVFCNTCAERNKTTADDALSWCRLCRGNGETRTMLPGHPLPGLFCHGCRLVEIMKPSDAHVLATCGHLLCAGCVDYLYTNPPTKIDGSPDLPRCHVQGCNYHLLGNEIRGDKLITRPGNFALKALGPGGKLQKTIEIVNAAKGNDEQVLVFVPYKEQMDGIHKCLEDAGISVVRTDGSDSIASLATFKAGRANVLLQLLNSPESAGSNLANANHIVFVGPYFTRDQRLWHMVVDQAIGRCVRPGQEKDVQVYHLVAENSLDVDVLEHHLKRRLEPDENGEVNLSGQNPLVPEGEVTVGRDNSSARGSMLQSTELDMLFRKMADYNDNENLF